MRQQQKALLIGRPPTWHWGCPRFARTAKLTGKMVGQRFNAPRLQSMRLTDRIEEVVVLETLNRKQKYVKVILSSLGTTQIEPKYFDATCRFKSSV